MIFCAFFNHIVDSDLRYYEETPFPLSGTRHSSSMVDLKTIDLEMMTMGGYSPNTFTVHNVPFRS